MTHRVNPPLLCAFFLQERKVVVLSHDLRSFDSYYLGPILGKIQQLCNAYDVEVAFETMSQLTQ